MLSGEISRGKYPVEAVAMMHRVCTEAESAMFYRPLFNELISYTRKRMRNGMALCCAEEFLSCRLTCCLLPVALTFGIDMSCLIVSFSWHTRGVNSFLLRCCSGIRDTEETVAIAAVNAAYSQNAAAIICLTTSGRTAAYVSKYRPQCPVLTVTRKERVTRQLHLYRSIFPMRYERAENISSS